MGEAHIAAAEAREPEAGPRGPSPRRRSPRPTPTPAPPPSPTPVTGAAAGRLSGRRTSPAREPLPADPAAAPRLLAAPLRCLLAGAAPPGDLLPAGAPRRSGELELRRRRRLGFRAPASPDPDPRVYSKP